MSRPKDRINIVYSTNPNFQYDVDREEEKSTLPPGQQKLYIELDKKGRSGKQVTLISGFIGNLSDLDKLAKQLKNLCGAGGSVDSGNILIQGDHREKILGFLQKNGFQVKRKGG